MSTNAPQLPSFDDIAFTMDALPDMDERFQFLIDLGRKLPALSPEKKTEENRVHGCQSTVWIDSSLAGEAMEFEGESDSMIVSGLIAILLSLYNGRRPAEVTAIDPHGEMGKLHLEHHLSPSRRNGLARMIERIQADATSASGGE